jgi:protein phosphatase
MAELRWGAATHPGQIRPDNEDSYVAEASVFAVADGMGGHSAGEVASALAVGRLATDLRGEGVTLPGVIAAINEANNEIFRTAMTNNEQHGMGTTITALAVITTAEGEALALANVGDSRTYLLRHGQLRAVTTDHSYVQELVSTGHLTEEEARIHPRRNIVTRALGIDPQVRVDAWTLPLVQGDRFLLCSDGLVDEVPDHEIADVLRGVADPQAASEQLVEMANRHGGRDNITVVVVDVVTGRGAPEADDLDLEPVWAEGVPEAAWEEADDATSNVVTSSPVGRVTDGDETTDEIPLVFIPDATDTAAATEAGKPAVPARPARPAKPKRRGRLLAAALVAVLATVSLAMVAAYARDGYFVAFDANDQVTIYRGRPGGLLWFDPTVENPTTRERADLDDASIARVEDRPRFDSLNGAVAFVQDQLEAATTTTTTTTTTSTTTTPATTTTTASTTTSTGESSTATTVATATSVAP